ncbi:MAG: choice-of-anchor B family protein [Phaeodactylibacter sp.]|nr:choice-of-anchor B family protein [Phaeodactylibacter sp.]MCB9273943.1 choice-of-anchor B family protein [Lewinellaceae bacterium]
MERWTSVALLLALPLFLTAQQQATLLGTWKDPILVGSSSYNNTYNEIWGVAVNGHEYAVIGSTAGTHFIDVTDPTHPFEAHRIAGAAQGGIVIHRDYHDYKGYLYAVCDEGPSTLQIMDLSHLPDSVPVVYDYGLQITRVHNIFIDTATAKLYTFSTSGGPAGYSAMRVYSLADPLNPEYLGKYNSFGGLTVGHVHDGYVRNDVAFLNCGGSGFALVDFSDPQNPQTISTLTDYPFRGYNHSGWLSDDAQYYYMGDENHGYDIKVLDVSNPCDIQVAGTFDAGVSNQYSIPHNQVLACNYLYVSYYYDGLAVFDLTDPANPQKVLYYDTSSEPDGPSYKGAWGVYPFLPSGNILISDMQQGLFVFQGVGDDCAATETLTPVDLSCLEVNSTVEQPEATAVEIFPQPAHNAFNVRFVQRNGQGKVNASLVDISGREVQRWELDGLGQGAQSLRFEVRDGLKPGLYLLRLQGDGLNVVKKVSLL